MYHDINMKASEEREAGAIRAVDDEILNMSSVRWALFEFRTLWKSQMRSPAALEYPGGGWCKRSRFEARETV